MMRFCLKTIAPLTLAAALGFLFGAARMPAAMEQASTAGNHKADVRLAAQIRRAVVDDKSLSIAAHNVDITVKDGIVTIRGQVPSIEERDSILQKARDIAGAQNVADSMVVTPPKSN